MQYRFSNPSVSLSKGSSTSNQAFLLRRKDVNRPTRCSEPLRSKVGGPSKVFAMLCGMGPPYYSSLIRTALLQLADWGGMATICYSLMIGGAWGTNCWLRLPFLFLTAVSLCTCRHSNEEYLLYSTFDRINNHIKIIVIHITCNHTIAFFINCSEFPNSCWQHQFSEDLPICHILLKSV